MRVIIISILIFIAQVYAAFNVFTKEEKSLTKQKSVLISANNFTFIKEETIKNEEIKQENLQDEGVKKTKAPKKISKITKTPEKIKKQEPTIKQKNADLEDKTQQIATKKIEGEENANSLNNNKSNSNDDEALAILINQLLNKYKKYPKKAKLLNLQGKVAGNFIIKNDELTINITKSSNEIFTKETKQTIKKVKNKIPKQAHNMKISFVINYKTNEGI